MSPAALEAEFWHAKWLVKVFLALYTKPYSNKEFTIICIGVTTFGIRKLLEKLMVFKLYNKCNLVLLSTLE